MCGAYPVHVGETSARWYARAVRRFRARYFKDCFFGLSMRAANATLLQA